LATAAVRHTVVGRDQTAVTPEGRSPDGMVTDDLIDFHVDMMMTDPAVRSRRTHNNKCMVTVFGRTRCVLDPDQRYGATAAAPEDEPASS
jgi:hypothetical protein